MEKKEKLLHLLHEKPSHHRINPLSLVGYFADTVRQVLDFAIFLKNGFAPWCGLIKEANHE